MSSAAVAAFLIIAAAALVARAAPGGYIEPGVTVEVSTARQWTPEAPCSREGGLCILAEECPPGSLHNTTGLCPQQQSSGVECCYGLSINERRCSARGGICRDRRQCGRQLWEENADDCAPSEKCCILVS